MEAAAILEALIQARSMIETGRQIAGWIAHQVALLDQQGKLTAEQKKAIDLATPVSEADWDDAVASAKARLGTKVPPPKP